MTRGAGNAMIIQATFGCAGMPEAGNASNSRAGSGVQQTRSLSAEKTVEVVRNHEGGTRFDGWYRRTEGSLGFREWTRRRSNGRGAASGRIPREEELEASSEAARSSGWSVERSEGEVKGHEGQHHRVRARVACHV
jgi:hypothetical protein